MTTTEQRAAVDGNDGAGQERITDCEQHGVSLLVGKADASRGRTLGEVREHALAYFVAEGAPERRAGIDDAGGDHIHANRSELDGHRFRKRFQPAVDETRDRAPRRRARSADSGEEGERAGGVDVRLAVLD